MPSYRMTTAVAKQQAEALHDFVKRGGSREYWFKSKDFNAREKRMIEKARADRRDD